MSPDDGFWQNFSSKGIQTKKEKKNYMGNKIRHAGTRKP